MAVLIKRYANRKLYNTETSRYITLKGIAELLEQDQEVKVIDNETGEDITTVTLSQILVDTERGGRAVPGNLLSELFQKGGDALYGALRRSVDDTREGVEEFQRNMRKMLGQEDGRTEWVAFTPPDLESIVQHTMERVVAMLDIPTRADIDALNDRLDKVLEAIEKSAEPRPRGPGGNSPGD
jgi:polyhydroxyalkanoate synthesis repressor PhaR